MPDAAPPTVDPQDPDAARAAEAARDRDLVARAKSGSAAAFDAFDELVTRHERRVYGLCYNILRDAHDAEDAVQTAFLNALEALPRFREDAAFGTWITRIAVNTALKSIRKRKGLPTVPLEMGSDDDDEARIPHPAYIAEWRDDPARLIEEKCVRKQIDAAIQELPEHYRVVFALRDLQGLSVAETAAVLELTPANVKVRLLRARLALRETLTRIFGDRRREVQTERAPDAYTLAEQLLRSYDTSGRG